MLFLFLKGKRLKEHKKMLQLFKANCNIFLLLNFLNFNVNFVLDGYAFDLKSIIGIFSLDLTDSLKVQVETKDPLNFFERIKEFIVKKWKYSSNKILHYLN